MSPFPNKLSLLGKKSSPVFNFQYLIFGFPNSLPIIIGFFYYLQPNSLKQRKSLLYCDKIIDILQKYCTYSMHLCCNMSGIVDGVRLFCVCSAEMIETTRVQLGLAGTWSSSRD